MKWSLTPFQAREADLEFVMRRIYKIKSKKELASKKFPDREKTRALAHHLYFPAALTEVGGKDNILTMMKLFCIDKFRRDRTKLKQALYEPGRGMCYPIRFIHSAATCTDTMQNDILSLACQACAVRL
jgi:hypothetical protein